MKTKQMQRLREIVRKYPLASAAVAGALALLVGWQVYQGVVTRRVSGPAAVAPPARTAPTPPRAPSPTTPGAPGPAAPGPGATPSGAANPPAPPSPITGVMPPAGRADPFIPLVSTGGGGGRLPPVPALSPSGVPLPGMPFPPGGPGGEGGLRVAGIIWDRGALAIVVDERGSYIVAPGDEITPGLRVVRIDVGRRVVEVQRSGVRQELTLQGRGGAVP